MLAGCGKDKKRFLLQCHHDLRLAGMMVVLHIVYFALSEDEGLGLDGPFLEGDPSGHVLDVLHDEIYRHSIISEPWNGDISIDSCR